MKFLIIKQLKKINNNYIIMNKYIKKILFPFVDNNYDLELKWWHRLIKVIFTLLIIISLISSMFLYYYSQENNNSSYLKSIWFSLIPTANAMETTWNQLDIKQQAISDIINWMPIEEFDNYYPELSDNKQIFEQLASDIKAGMPKEEISNYYPELNQPVSDINQPQEEQWLIIKLIISILLSIMSTYILNLLLQIIYYKIILYVIYGKNLNSSATTKN